MDGPCMMDRPVSGLLLFRQVENKQEYLQLKQYFFQIVDALCKSPRFEGGTLGLNRK